jgi:hypothetical protein
MKAEFRRQNPGVRIQKKRLRSRDNKFPYMVIQNTPVDSHLPWIPIYRDASHHNKLRKDVIPVETGIQKMYLFLRCPFNWSFLITRFSYLF